MRAGLLICIASLSSIASPARADVYAIVVGVNELPELRLLNDGVVRPLRGAIRDAERTAELLQSRFKVPVDHIELKVGKDASRAQVLEAFQKLTILMKPEDTLLFHFSGHGTRVPDKGTEEQPDGDEDDGLDEAICLYDTKADGSGLILDDELGKMLETLPANDLLVVLDCCHAGTGIKAFDPEETTDRYLNWSLVVPKAAKKVVKDTANGTVKGLDAEASPPASELQMPAWNELISRRKSLTRRVDAFFACLPEQSAYERRLPGEANRAGLFSFYFWSGLVDNSADADRDGAVSRCEAINYAIKRVDEDFNRTRSSAHARQTPMFQAGGSGEVPFLPGARTPNLRINFGAVKSSTASASIGETPEKKPSKP